MTPGTGTRAVQPIEVGGPVAAPSTFRGGLAALTILVAVSMIAPNAGADVYKWVDDRGRVHYGDSPPPDQSVQSVRTPPPPPEEEVLRSRSRMDELTEDRKSDQEQEAQRRKEETAAERERIARENRCRAAKRELHVLELERPVYRLDEEGNRVYLDDDRRATEIGRARGRIRDYCR